MIGQAAAAALINMGAKALLDAKYQLASSLQPVPVPLPPQSWGALGTLVFTCMNGPYEFNDKQGMDFAEHAMAFDKPHLQLVGTKLEEITLKIRLHQFLTSSPTVDLRNLLEAMRKGEPQDLVIGQDTTGNYAGQFVIVDLAHDRLEQWPNGLIKLAELTLTLKEWVAPSSLSTSTRTAPPPAVRPKGKTTSPSNQVNVQTKTIGSGLTTILPGGTH